MSETLSICGVCLRLLASLPPKGSESRWLSRWMQTEPGLFGPLPADTASQQQALAERLACLPEDRGDDLRRLGAIAQHCDLLPAEAQILEHLALRARKGAMDHFHHALSRGLGLAPEAVIGWCCNLEPEQVWALLAPSGWLIRAGFVTSDASAPFQQDEAYALSGLLTALISPPAGMHRNARISPLTMAQGYAQDARES